MKTALIIEDDENNIVLISRLLEKAGYRTITADTGKRGLELLLQKKPAFIRINSLHRANHKKSASQLYYTLDVSTSLLRGVNTREYTWAHPGVGVVGLRTDDQHSMTLADEVMKI